MEHAEVTSFIPQMRMEPFGGLGTGGFQGRWNRNQLQKKQLYQIRLLFHFWPCWLTVYISRSAQTWITLTQKPTMSLPDSHQPQIGADDIQGPFCLCCPKICSLRENWGTFSPRLNLVTLLPGGVCVLRWWVGWRCVSIIFFSQFFFLFFFQEEIPEMGWDEHPGHVPSGRQRLWPDEDRRTQHTLQQVRGSWKSFPLSVSINYTVNFLFGWSLVFLLKVL